MTLPLARYASAGDPVLLGVDQRIGAGAFFMRAKELAGAIPARSHVINLCESRLAFMLGFAAALMRGQSSLLPSGQGSADWKKLRGDYPDAVTLTDRDMADSDGFETVDLRPFMVIGYSDLALQHFDIPADLTAAILFTSGSTGQPTAHAKTWQQLCAGARGLARALATQAPGLRAVIGSVPPQHMFGLETTVMLPWMGGVAVHSGKPLLPADLETAISQCDAPCWWMTTPVHLRPALQATSRLPGLAGIVASTMSLPPAAAREAEELWRVPVVEIYGSTETGALATRRTANESLWAPLEGVSLESMIVEGEQRVTASGLHVGESVVLGDELRIEVDGRFQWVGRSADMVKIGGKRASIAALNQQILSIPGVDDAAFFAVDEADGAASHDGAHPAHRLAAFYVSASMTPRELQAALRALVDPVFVPRPVFRVPQLPRNATGKLPRAALAALWQSLSGKPANGGVGGVIPPRSRVVPRDHPAIAGHFPGDPIVPGAMILTEIAAAIGAQLPGVPLGKLIAMRFHRPLLPGQAFAIQAQLRDERVIVEVRTTAAAADSLVASGQWACMAATPAGADG